MTLDIAQICVHGKRTVRRAMLGSLNAHVLLKPLKNASGAIRQQGDVDEAHCCDTSRSLRLLIGLGQHSKATSSEQGCKPALVK